jgi:predicted ATPase
MTSLIKSLTLRNFKGFSDEVRIELRPITLLFGANSAGKSSVLQALQYFHEVLAGGNLDADSTRHGGGILGLGGFQNLVNGRDKGKSIEIGIQVSLGDTSMLDNDEDEVSDFESPSEGLQRLSERLNEFKRHANEVELRLKVGWSDQRNEPFVQEYKVLINGVWCAQITASSDGRQAFLKLHGSHPLFMVSNDEVGNLVSELDGLVLPSDLAFDNELPPMGEKRGESRHASWLPDVFFDIQEHGAEPAGAGFTNWMRAMDGARPKFNSFRIKVPGGKTAESLQWVKQFESFLSWLLVGPAEILRAQLRGLRYVGPLRVVPERGNANTRRTGPGDWANGSAAWVSLANGSAALRARVSHWMNDVDRLNTGYMVSLRTTKEFEIDSVDERPGEPVGQKRIRIAFRDRAGLEHEPQDVGVGISQILPVAVAALDGRATLVCIEQPELHVHPAVQVGLGDLFIEGAINQGLSFLIETHSEHMILRLLRRIREVNEDALVEESLRIDASEISVNCLSREGGVVSVDRIPITPDGDFSRPWPHGFFDERGTELF